MTVKRQLPSKKMDHNTKTMSLRSPVKGRIQLNEITKNQKVRIVCLAILIGFVSATIHYCYLDHIGFKDNIYQFLFSPEYCFNDFTNISKYIKGNNPYGMSSAVVSYFPFLYRVASFFDLFPVFVSLGILVSVFLMFLAFSVWRSVSTGMMARDAITTLIFVCLTYPVVFAISRGNYELLIFIFLFLFLKSFEKKNYWVSVLYLSMAVAMKAFPAIFLVLFIKEKRFKEAFAVLVVAATLTLASYASFTGSVVHNFRVNMENLQAYNAGWAIGMHGLAFGGNSLFGTLRILIGFLRPEHFYETVQGIMTIYSLVSLITFGFIAIYIWVIEKSFWKCVALIVFSMNLLPHVSADYKLIHIFFPMLLFFQSAEKNKGDLLFSILFSLLLIPKSYYYFVFPESARVAPYVVNISAVLNPLLMGTFALIIMLHGFKNKFVKIMSNLSKSTPG